MNRKGQTLIIFVILIPIIITMIALVVDVGILVHEFSKTRGIIDNGIELYYEKNDIYEISKILTLNDIPTENLEIEKFGTSIEVSIFYKMDSLFGKIIHLQNYDIEMTRVGTKENDRIVITRKDS